MTCGGSQLSYYFSRRMGSTIGERAGREARGQSARTSLREAHAVWCPRWGCSTHKEARRARVGDRRYRRAHPLGNGVRTLLGLTHRARRTQATTASPGDREPHRPHSSVHAGAICVGGDQPACAVKSAARCHGMANDGSTHSLHQPRSAARVAPRYSSPEPCLSSLPWGGCSTVRTADCFTATVRTEPVDHADALVLRAAAAAIPPTGDGVLDNSVETQRDTRRLLCHRPGHNRGRQRRASRASSPRRVASRS